MVGDVPLELRKQHDVAREESKPRPPKALFVVLVEEPREPDLAAERHRQLEIRSERDAFDLEVNRVGVVEKPDIALADLVFAACLEENEPKSGHFGREREILNEKILFAPVVEKPAFPLVNLPEQAGGQSKCGDSHGPTVADAPVAGTSLRAFDRLRPEPRSAVLAPRTASAPNLRIRSHNLCI